MNVIEPSNGHIERNSLELLGRLERKIMNCM
jgi:hypothetical protein